MPKTLTLRLDDETYRVLREAAKAERRSIANLVETAAMERIREQQFVDEFEMAEILANEKLVKRLREGSRDARKRSGKFVA